MSDVAIAPAPAPAPAPASAPAPSAPREAVINESPVAAPAPVGSQAPPRPPTRSNDDIKASRRETISKAFERAKVERAGPAEAKMGHNQPPEPTPKERSQPPLNLRQPPPAQKQRRAQPPFAGPGVAAPRGEHGHFAPRPGQGTGQRPRSAPLPATAPYHQPPPRMANHARAEWAATPQSVRGEVHRMYNEFSRAYHEYRGAAEAMRPIAHYHHLALSQGTTLRRVLDNYTTIERKILADPIGGFDIIANNLGLETAQGQRIGLRDIAWHVLNQTPDQHRATQLQNSQVAHNHQLARMQAQVAWLAQQNQRMQYAAQYQRLRGGVDRFAEAHPRLDELGDDIIRELKLGFNLPTAYRRAELLRPAQAAQTRTRTAQTRISDRSISGAPGSGPSFNGQGRRPHKPVSRRDALLNAVRHVNGSL